MLGALVAGGLSLAGGALANRGRTKEAGKDRDWQSGEADKNRAFQQRMSSTSWQRGVEDMRAAGINPAVAYSQGGASSPSGGMGGGSTARQEDVGTQAVSSAMQYKRLNAEIESIKAQTARTRVDTQVAEGRPSRVLGGAVDAGGRAVDRMFGAEGQGILTPKNMSIIRYEVAHSAKTVGDAIDQTVAKIRRAIMGRLPGSGSNFNSRRNRR